MIGIDFVAINQAISIIIVSTFISIIIAINDKINTPSKALKLLMLGTAMNDISGTLAGMLMMGMSGNLLLSWSVAGIGALLGMKKMAKKFEKFIDKKMGVENECRIDTDKKEVS